MNGARDALGRLRFRLRGQGPGLPLHGPGEYDTTDAADAILSGILHMEEVPWGRAPWRRIAVRLRGFLNAIVAQAYAAGFEEARRIERDGQRYGS